MVPGMPRGLYTPSGAITALRQRAEAVAPGAFEADVRLLFFLAGRLHQAVEMQDAGSERDATREFNLQFRATLKSVRELEEAEARKLAEAEKLESLVMDWKAEMEEDLDV